MAFGAYYTASETLALPGHCALLSSFAICVYLWLNDALVWAEVLDECGVVGRRAKLAYCRV